MEREALKLGLTALKNAIAVRNGEGGTMLFYPLEENAITAIKEALAQPPQRPWVGLTAEETSGFTSHEMTVVKYVSKVLQEKNT